MNIIEAIKSGKRFRRKGQTRYLELFHDIDLCLSVGDITADDWEVEEKKAPISASEFDHACKVVDARLWRNGGWPVHINEFLTELKKELGL
jgi:hypothetical protein